MRVLPLRLEHHVAAWQSSAKTRCKPSMVSVERLAPSRTSTSAAMNGVSHSWWITMNAFDHDWPGPDAPSAASLI
jgi:hypothetical protein